MGSMRPPKKFRVCTQSGQIARVSGFVCFYSNRNAGALQARAVREERKFMKNLVDGIRNRKRRGDPPKDGAIIMFGHGSDIPVLSLVSDEEQRDGAGAGVRAMLVPISST
jgi:hypothetical protein